MALFGATAMPRGPLCLLPDVGCVFISAQNLQPTPSDRWQNLQMISLDGLPISERFVRASGPGGQNVNKVATAVELRLDVPSAPLPEHVKTRLAVLAGSRMTTDGVLLIDSREYRTQVQNREAARARLQALLDEASVRPKVRRKTKPTKAAKARRTTEKVQRSETKKHRRRILSDD